MKRLPGLFLLLLAPAAAAQPLNIATVSSPAVQCVFSAKCKVSVEDLSAPVAARGFLQSRNYKAAAGLYVYEYRIDLRDVVGRNGITALAVDVGPTAKIDFNGDGRKEDVFVTTKGSLGNVGLHSAVRSGNRITFTFQPPVAGGSAPGKGDSTLFFGLVSKHSPPHRRGERDRERRPAADARRLGAVVPLMRTARAPGISLPAKR
jgi:hypothetical protein